MGKHKKTRREKKIADNRHTLYHLETNTPQKSKNVEEKIEVEQTKTYQSPSVKQTTSLSYVAKDIRKILLFSSILIATQIVLYIVLNSV